MDHIRIIFMKLLNIINIIRAKNSYIRSNYLELERRENNLRLMAFVLPWIICHLDVIDNNSVPLHSASLSNSN